MGLSEELDKRKCSMRKIKKQKLESKAKIRRRLYRLWSQKVMLLNGNACAVTGTKNGEIIDGKPAILDGHHLENRITCQALRFDALNGIALNKRSHKFGRNSAHKGPIWFAEWLRTHRPLQYAYVLAHRNDPIDLENREVLYAIEEKLKAPPTDSELLVLNLPRQPVETETKLLSTQQTCCTAG